MSYTRTCQTLFLFAVIYLPLARPAVCKETAYDPLAVTSHDLPKPVDLSFADAARKREIPVRVYLPTEKAAAPVVLFSHGLGGSREGSSFLGKHWAARGYVCVFVQHHGSDTAIWQGKPPEEARDALKSAMNLENFFFRVQDVPAVLDQLQHWNLESGHALHGRLDMKRVGMSGHSFGAVTTQAVSGQVFDGGSVSYVDPRIKAAVIFSPSSPKIGTAKDGFAAVKIPWMLMTGTKDVVPMLSSTDVKSRLAVFASLPPGAKYEVVLDRAEHSAFTDRPLPGDTEKRNPNHHRVILALSTAFWDAYLRDDRAAKAWLDGDGPKSVLEKGDRWERK